MKTLHSVPLKINAQYHMPLSTRMAAFRMYFRIYIRTKQYKYCTQTVTHKAHHEGKPHHVTFCWNKLRHILSCVIIKHFTIFHSQVFQSPYNLTLHWRTPG